MKRNPPSTIDPTKRKAARLKAALAAPASRKKSNREIAKLVGVDESTVRKYRAPKPRPETKVKVRTVRVGRHTEVVIRIVVG